MNDKIKKEWFVYMIRCMDSSLYTGITTDVKRRYEEHENCLLYTSDAADD